MPTEESLPDAAKCPNCSEPYLANDYGVYCPQCEHPPVAGNDKRKDSPAFSARQYKVLARVIAKVRYDCEDGIDLDGVYGIAKELTKELEKDNPNFDEGRFFDRICAELNKLGGGAW